MPRQIISQSLRQGFLLFPTTVSLVLSPKLQINPLSSSSLPGSTARQVTNEALGKSTLSPCWPSIRGWAYLAVSPSICPSLIHSSRHAASCTTLTIYDLGSEARTASIPSQAVHALGKAFSGDPCLAFLKAVCGHQRFFFSFSQCLGKVTIRENPAWHPCCLESHIPVAGSSPDVPCSTPGDIPGSTHQLLSRHGRKIPEC